MSKWEKYCVLQEDEQINSMLPETRLMTEENLWDLLSKRGTAILKPANGSGGAGVIIVFDKGDDNFLVQIKQDQQLVKRDDLFSCLTQEIFKEFAEFIDPGELNKILEETYIIQHRISLAEVDNCPFDIRVMVQRTTDTPWKVTGKLAKLASSGFFITNVNLGATILPLETVVQRSSLQNLSQDDLLSQLDDTGLLAAEQFQLHYPSIREIGFDMCFDQQGKVWIIEANFKPHDFLFLELEDKSMYQTIQEYRGKKE